MGALWGIGVRWSGPPQLATPRPVKSKSLGVGLGTNVLNPSQVTQAQPGLSTSQDLHWLADLCTNGAECDHSCLSLSWERANCVGRQCDLSYFINMPFKMPSPPVPFSLSESCHWSPHLVPELSSYVCSQSVPGQPRVPHLIGQDAEGQRAKPPARAPHRDARVRAGTWVPSGSSLPTSACAVALSGLRVRPCCVLSSSQSWRGRACLVCLLDPPPWSSPGLLHFRPSCWDSGSFFILHLW